MWLLDFSSKKHKCSKFQYHTSIFWETMIFETKYGEKPVCDGNRRGRYVNCHQTLWSAELPILLRKRVSSSFSPQRLGPYFLLVGTRLVLHKYFYWNFSHSIIFEFLKDAGYFYSLFYRFTETNCCHYVFFFFLHLLRYLSVSVFVWPPGPDKKRWRTEIRYIWDYLVRNRF